jgi:CRISPR-associated endoribonuclease Cas6
MRLLLRLKCSNSSLYEMQYHYHLQGFIYHLLKGSIYEHIHDKEGYKFFCFSNIFPAKNLQKGDIRTLIISSPDLEFILHLDKVLRHEWSTAEINVGCMKFRIDYIDKLVKKVPNDLPVTLITGTPIIVRIPSEKYIKYGIEPKREYGYIYWRSGHPIDLFISQVQSNLLKKYSEYCTLTNIVEDEHLTSSRQQTTFSFFQKLKFKKQISTRVIMKGFEQVIIGTVWEFVFNPDFNPDLIQFALDAGLGFE